jgi:hypothetical protein
MPGEQSGAGRVLIKPVMSGLGIMDVADTGAELLAFDMMTSGADLAV